MNTIVTRLVEYLNLHKRTADQKVAIWKDGNNTFIGVQCDRFFDRLAGNGHMYTESEAIIINKAGVIVNNTGLWKEVFKPAVISVIGERAANGYENRIAWYSIRSKEVAGNSEAYKALTNEYNKVIEAATA